MAHTLALEWAAIWRIAVISLVLGAGLPAVFAAGVRALAHGQGGEAKGPESGGTTPAPHPVGRILAGLCFTVVVVAVVLGIVFIVVSGLGRELSFEHVYPVIRDK